MPVTRNEFRRMALDFPETVESAHTGHPDFRVCGKIFATLSHPGKPRGMVKLTPDQQEVFMADHPRTFEPASGAWGRQGCTMVALKVANKTTLRRAILAAWLNSAPRALAKQVETRD